LISAFLFFFLRCWHGPCSAGHVSACFSLFQFILSHITLLNQPKPAGFYTSRTSPWTAAHGLRGALFRSWELKNFLTVAFSFIFNKYSSIMG
jgi:hypothetical protein